MLSHKVLGLARASNAPTLVVLTKASHRGLTKRMRLHRSVRDRLRGSEPCSRPSITAVRRLPTAFLSLCPLPLRPELSVFFFQPKFKQPAPNSPGLTRLGERGFQIRARSWNSQNWERIVESYRRARQDRFSTLDPGQVVWGRSPPGLGDPQGPGLRPLPRNQGKKTKKSK